MSAVAVPLREAAGRVWGVLLALWGAFIGLLPHLLHHVGPLAGAAIFAGAAGAALFGAIGFVAAIPFLLRLHRRFRTWKAPALALALFAAMFTLSTLVIGPWIGGLGEEPAPAVPAAPAAPAPAVRSGHAAHH